jgi:hypothetical protein
MNSLKSSKENKILFFIGWLYDLSKHFEVKN